MKIIDKYIDWVSENPKKAIGYSILFVTVLIIVVASLTA